MISPYEQASRVHAAFRVDGYRLLASILAAAPSTQLLAWLSSLELQGEPLAELEADWLALRQAAEQAAQEQVADEYQQLFVGVGRGELMPYGSWYLTGFLMEKPLIALRQALAELGFERSDEVKEPEDHIAALCEVMALLGSEEEADSGQQQRFFESHLAPWAERFFKDMQQSHASHFYAAVGQFGERFIAKDKQFLGYAAGH